jgi:hypothetical protein
MSAVATWLSVKNVAGVIDLLVKVAALAAALLAANFFLFRADVSHVATAGDGVDRTYVIERYRAMKQGVPDVVQATMADVEEGVVPAGFVESQSPLVADEELFCGVFRDHVKAVVGDKACAPGNQGAVADMSRAQLLLLVNNNAPYLYRDPASWIIRTKRPHPSGRSETLPDPIRTPEELTQDWATLRAALVDRVVVTVTNKGRATAEHVHVTPPAGLRALDEREFEIPADESVTREYVAAGGRADASVRGFAVTSESGSAPTGWYLAFGVVAVGLLLALLAVFADIVRGPPAPASGSPAAE